LPSAMEPRDLFRFECAGPRDNKQQDQGGQLNVKEEVSRLYSALSRLSDRIDAIQEEHTKVAEAGNMKSAVDGARLEADWAHMQQEYSRLQQTWDAMHAAQQQRDVEWDNVKQVLRKFFEQHHFELQQMHEQHRQEVHKQLAPVLAKFDAQQMSEKLQGKFRDELQAAKREFTEFSQQELTRELSLVQMQNGQMANGSDDSPGVSVRLMRITEEQSFRITKLEGAMKVIGKLNKDGMPAAIDDINTKLGTVTKDHEEQRNQLQEVCKQLDFLKGRHDHIGLLHNLVKSSKDENQKVDPGDIKLLNALNEKEAKETAKAPQTATSRGLLGRCWGKEAKNAAR